MGIDLVNKTPAPWVNPIPWPEDKPYLHNLLGETTILDIGLTATNVNIALAKATHQLHRIFR